MNEAWRREAGRPTPLRLEPEHLILTISLRPHYILHTIPEAGTVMSPKARMRGELKGTHASTFCLRSQRLAAAFLFVLGFVPHVLHLQNTDQAGQPLQRRPERVSYC